MSIERDGTAVALLKLLRPKTKKIARYLARRLRAPLRDCIADVESATIELLLTDYEMGERIWPLVWLYNAPYGAVLRWAKRQVAAEQRYNAHVSPVDIAELDGPAESPAVADPEPSVAVTAARAIVEDGLTLRSSEYRIVRYCMAYGVDGGHQRLAGLTGATRRSVTRTYATATRRLIEASGQTSQVLQRRGVYAQHCDTERRRRFLLGIPDPCDRLTSEERNGLLALVRSGTPTTTACWAYGVSDKVYYGSE